MLKASNFQPKYLHYLTNRSSIVPAYRAGDFTVTFVIFPPAACHSLRGSSRLHKIVTRKSKKPAHLFAI